jgi:ribosomal protein S18 acetylase RimI-like enzyme
MNSNDILNTCENLLDFLSQCSYGIPVDGKITEIETAEYFDKHYKLLSPKQFMHYMGGVCWDYVEFEAWYLAKNNLKFHKYYIATNTEDVDTHTFILVEYNDKYLYIESSFKLLEGIYTINSLQDAVQLITNKMFSLNKEASRYAKINYYVWEYIEHPPYGSNYIECMKYFTNGEPIYEYTAINTIIKIYFKKATSADVSNIYRWTMNTIPKKWWNDETYRLIKRDAWESIHKTRMIYLKDTEDISPKEPIGMITAYRYTYKGESNWWYIAEIYLIEDYRGIGIGKAVLENEISKHNKLLLQVDKDNIHAIELYKSLGFETVYETDDSYEMILVK